MDEDQGGEHQADYLVFPNSEPEGDDGERRQKRRDELEMNQPAISLGDGGLMINRGGHGRHTKRPSIGFASG
jgi:hypothetical protein